MYRLEYKNLTKQQVEDVLGKSGAPICASSFCPALAGKEMKLVLDKLPVEGPALEYEFKSDTKLTVKENGGATVACDYGAHSLGDITMFSHMVSGTKRGYTVILNRKTSVVTVFEMWFIDYEGARIDTAVEIIDPAKVASQKPFVNREVQRQCYYGYIDEPGKTPPEQRDRFSLRLEHSMIKWEDDRGLKRLTTYASATFSTFVELDTPDGGDVLSFVSDTLQASETVFIHCFGEVEYSGRLSVEVFDLFSMKKIGVTIGIDENDAFEHTLYKGCGKFLGRYATFFEFNDKGDQYSDAVKSRLDPPVKGTRQAYRPSVMAKKITKDALAEIAKEPVIFNPKAANWSISNTLDASEYCVGKSVTFRGDDGYSVELNFKSAAELSYRADGESEWHTEQYYAMEIDAELIILGFYRTGTNPPAAMFLALDFMNGCATCIAYKVGTKYNLRDVDSDYHFGVIEADGVNAWRVFRHGFTFELLGRAFSRTWNDGMTSIHIYNSPRSYSWTITNTGTPGTPSFRAGGPAWSSPCEYLKLREDVYVMNWVQQKWDGLQGLFCMNLRTMHDCGFSFAVREDGEQVIFDKQGCFSRPAGFIDLSDVYSLKNYNTRA